MNEILRIIRAKPLILRKDNILKLKKGNIISWADFGEINKNEIKHVIFYFHGTPSCRFEPLLHSTLPKDLNGNNSENYDDYIDKNGSMTNIYDNDHESNHNKNPNIGVNINLNNKVKENDLDVYKQKGIRLICIERPGFGLSTYKDIRNLEDFVDDVVEVIGRKEMGLFDDYHNDDNGISITHSIKNFDSNIESDKNSEIEKTFMKSTDGDSSIANNENNDMKIISNKNIDIDGILEKNENDKTENTSKKNVEISVMGFSAGGPYALSMRYLLQEKLNKFKLPCKLKGVAVIASSASIYDNISYQKSTEGKILRIFFSLPENIQGYFYFGGISGIFLGLNMSILSLNGIKYALLLGSKKENVENIINIIEKIKSMKYVLNSSFHANGSRSVVTDTLLLQSKNHPWGLNLVSNDPLLPPLLLYYSKEDYTVPYQTGIWLAGKTLGDGKEPKWLTGGHNCMFLHLNEILDDLINT